MLCALILAALTAPALPDDTIPTTLEALLAQPEDAFLAAPETNAPATVLFSDQDAGETRCLADLGDVTGDDVPDLLLGHAPGTVGPTLEARDGATGAVLWSATPDGGSFRTLRGLDARNGRVALGVTSLSGRVQLRDAATGATLWTKDLQSAGLEEASINAVHLCDDVDGDGIDEVLIGAGQGVNGVLLVRGATGANVFKRVIGDVVYDCLLTEDLDGNGSRDVYALGGDGMGFICAMSGDDGSDVWVAFLDGPGSCVAEVQDLDGDGIVDMLAGQFAAPLGGVRAFSGADGSDIWTATGVNADVTSLEPLGDVSGDAITDFVVGSLSPRVIVVSGATGETLWRHVVPGSNGGDVLSVCAAGDLDGDGITDVAAASVDHFVSLFHGATGLPFAQSDLRAKGTCVARLADPTGEGVGRVAATGQGVLTILDGNSGLASGPVLVGPAEVGLNTNLKIQLWADPGAPVFLLGALGTGHWAAPGFDQPLELDLGTLLVIAAGAPPTEQPGNFGIGPLPRGLVGAALHLQAATVAGPGTGTLSDPLVIAVTH